MAATALMALALLGALPVQPAMAATTAQEAALQRKTADLPGRLSLWFGIVNNTDTSFADAVYFLDNFQDWPARHTLQRRAEQLMPADAPQAVVLSYYKKYPAISARGVQRHVAALLQSGQESEAARVTRSFWREAEMEAAEETEFLKGSSRLLRPRDHEARLDYLLWEGRTAEARRQSLRVGEGLKLVALARIALAAQDGGAEAALGRVPAALRSDPGLIYERVRWRRRRDLTEDAIALLVQQPKGAEHADAWWTERNILARRLLQAGQIDRAQRLAAGHGAAEGDSLFEAEFLAGWIALRFQNKPQVALKHFHALEKAVTSPISQARAHYWLARALEATGSRQDATAHLREAAQYRATYYGQIAAAQLDKAATVDLTARGADANERRAFAELDLVRVTLSMPTLGPEFDRTTLFFTRMGQVLDRTSHYRLAAELASSTGRDQLAVKMGKQAASRGMGIVPEAYPLLSFKAPSAPEAALIHSIVRQESEFNPGAQSPVGAAGLMQVMPRTGQAVAGKLGIATSDSMMKAPKHNVTLGSAYLQSLIERYNGSYVLAIAAYNAGPTRVSGWLTDYGDPRLGAVDTIDWVESIPFSETRNYVMRVMEATQVYRARLNKGQARIGVLQDLSRGAVADR